MSHFCTVCHSLLVFAPSGDGTRQRICPRCGPVPGPPQDQKGNGSGTGSTPAPANGRSMSRPRRGVSPRNSPYARRTIYESVTRAVDDIKPPPSDGKGPTPAVDGASTGVTAGKMFPFDTIRMGQYDFFRDVGSAVKGGQFLIANVPTGIGKTAAALSAAIENALPAGKMVLFMTSKQSQHSIAVDTLRRLSQRSGTRIRCIDIISKQAMCPRELGRLPHATFNFLCKEQAKDGSCPYYRAPPEGLVQDMLSSVRDVRELVDMSLSRRICPHRAALEAARSANVLICDFNYLFSDLSKNVLAGLGRDLSELVLIVDEAHNLPDRIRNNLSEELPVRLLDAAKDECSKDRYLRYYLNEIKKLILEKCKKEEEMPSELELDKREFISELRGLFRSSLDREIEAEDLIEMLSTFSKEHARAEEDDPLTPVISFLSGLLQLRDSHILFLLVPEGKSMDSLRIAYKNLDPSEISGPIFKNCHSAVLMSGTLSPPSMFGDILGMARSRRTEKEYPSPFPEGNRLVLLDDKVTTAFKRRGEDMYRSMAERIVSLTGRFPGNVAAFFPSYSVMLEVKRFLWGCPKKLIVEERQMTKAEKEGLLDGLKRARAGGGALMLAVMGGSLSEGVDYRDNLLSGVLVVGLPLAPPSLEVKALREHYRGKFGALLGDDYSYNYPAVNKVLQAAGRSIRSEQDRSVVVLMEERMKDPRYLKFLPPEMRPKRTGALTLEQTVDRFFGGAPDRGNAPPGP